MAMESILDGVRRIVHKWVDTTTRIVSDITAGDITICLKNAQRLTVGDPVMLKNDTVYEPDLYIADIDELANLVTLTSPVANNWSVADNTVLIKTIYDQFVQGIYIGEPDVIPRFPAITVNGVSRSSEWFTLESTKERYEIEIGVFVQASTHENGYRFLMNIADEIQKGLKRNIQPLVSDYTIISLVDDISSGDLDIKVNNRDELTDYRRILIEDEYESEEAWVTILYADTDDSLEQTIRLQHPVCFDWDKGNASVVIPKRFIFNSWPSNIQYGTIHKGTLLKAAKISWFAEEEEMQFLRREELKLR